MVLLSPDYSGCKGVQDPRTKQEGKLELTTKVAPKLQLNVVELYLVPSSLLVQSQTPFPISHCSSAL